MRRWPIVVLAAVVLVAGLLLVNRFVAPVPGLGGVTADQAVIIARDFAVAGQASNETISEVRSANPTLHGSAWQVPVDLAVAYGPPGVASPGPSLSPGWIHYLIDVDRASGQATIEAQG